MKKAFKILLFVLGFCVFAVAACVLLPDPYAKAYQRDLVRQYDYYNSLEDNKMVFLGSSSLSFGLDLDEMEALSGRPCALLGNHFGYGMSFLAEMSKSNLRSGDIVVIEIVAHTIDTCGADLLLSGIGHRYEMYRFFIPETWGKVVSAYPAYLKKALLYDLDGGYEPGEGPYTINSFDKRGAMIYERHECEIPTPFQQDRNRNCLWIEMDGTPYQKEYVAYINAYTAYCKSKGAEVYLTLPCYLRESVVSPEEDVEAFEQMLETVFDAPLISKQSDYFFERDLLYDGNMHCNTEGARVRTDLIYRDLVRAGAFG